MSSYKAPETSEGRLTDFSTLVEEFKTEYAIFAEKGKKTSAYRARKALLSISKLCKLIRNDIAASIDAEKEEEKVSVANDVQPEVQKTEQETTPVVESDVVEKDNAEPELTDVEPTDPTPAA